MLRLEVYIKLLLVDWVLWWCLMMWQYNNSLSYVLDVSSLLFPQDSHSRSAGNGSHSVTFGPSIEIWIKWSRVLVFKRFRCAVFMRFMLENTLSTSALAAGRTANLAKRSDMRGNREDIVSLFAGKRITFVTTWIGVSPVVTVKSG